MPVSVVHVQTLAAAMHGEVWKCDTARSLDHPVLFWITRGQGRFMIDCRVRGVSPNTVVYIPAHTLFSYEMFARPQGMVVGLTDEHSTAFPARPALLRAKDVPEQAEITSLIDTLSREIAKPRLHKDRAIEAHIMLISVWLGRLIADYPATRGVQGSDQSEALLEQFSHVISINHDSGKSIAEFASDLNVNAATLTTLTQNSTGKPAATLLDEHRINAACKALARTDQPIEEIANRLGFPSPGTFTRTFQAQTGKNPLSFRKNAK